MNYWLLQDTVPLLRWGLVESFSVCLFAQAAVTGHRRPWGPWRGRWGGVKQQKCICSQFWRLEVQDQGVARVLRGLSPRLADGRLARSSRGRPATSVSSSPLPRRTLAVLDEDPPPDLRCLSDRLKGPISGPPHRGVVQWIGVRLPGQEQRLRHREQVTDPAGARGDGTN